MNPDVLAGLLKRVYEKFDMMTFNDRLKVQKFIYLLQAYGLNLGYRYSLYLRGPYCTEVTKDAFQIEDFERAPALRFSDELAEERFVRFIRFFRNHKDDVDWLEIASSIIILKEIYKQDRDFTIKMVKDKSDSLSEMEGRISSIWDELEKEGLINA